MGWQAIEDAPEEGLVLGWSEEHEYNLIYLKYKLEQDGRVDYYNGEGFVIVTDWQPLAAPPMASHRDFCQRP